MTSAFSKRGSFIQASFDNLFLNPNELNNNYAKHRHGEWKGAKNTKSQLAARHSFQNNPNIFKAQNCGSNCGVTHQLCFAALCIFSYWLWAPCQGLAWLFGFQWFPFNLFALRMSEKACPLKEMPFASQNTNRILGGLKATKTSMPQ